MQSIILCLHYYQLYSQEIPIIIEVNIRIVFSSNPWTQWKTSGPKSDRAHTVDTEQTDTLV